jgi:hypothetical protein
MKPDIVKQPDGSTSAMPSPYVPLARSSWRVLPLVRCRCAVGALSVVWPEGRALVLDCDVLAAVW